MPDLRRDGLSLVSLSRVAGLALLWGSNFFFIAVALRSFSPGVISFVRLALAAVVLVAFARARGLKLPARELWWHLGVAAAVANVAPYFLFAWAEQRISSSAAGVLNSSTPIMTLLLTAAVLRTRTIGVRQVFGVVLGFAGVILILEPWETGIEGERAGQLAVLAASACYAISYVYMSRYLTNRNLPSLALAAGQMVFAAALGLPLIGLDTASNSTAQYWPVISLIVLGAIGTGVAYVLNYQIIESDGPTTASTVLYLLPVVAGVLGYVALDEPIGVTFVVGAIVVLLGVFFCRSRPTKTHGTTGRTATLGTAKP